MEPENNDWDNIESIYVEDDTYENFDAPKWVDLSASDELLVDDESWFSIHECKHPKTAEDFTKPRNSKAKLLKLKAISEILPFRDRNRRENSSVAESSSNVKSSEKPRRPNCSVNFIEDNENKNPNFSTSKSNSGSNKTKKPLMRPNRELPKHLNDTMEHPAQSDRKSHLKSTFSAQNLLGGRDLLSQITGFYSELKRLARKGSKNGATEKPTSGVSKELQTLAERERAPLLVVKEGRT